MHNPLWHFQHSCKDVSGLSDRQRCPADTSAAFVCRSTDSAGRQDRGATQQLRLFSRQSGLLKMAHCPLSKPLPKWHKNIDYAKKLYVCLAAFCRNCEADCFSSSHTRLPPSVANRCTTRSPESKTVFLQSRRQDQHHPYHQSADLDPEVFRRMEAFSSLKLLHIC